MFFAAVSVDRTVSAKQCCRFCGGEKASRDAVVVVVLALEQCGICLMHTMYNHIKSCSGSAVVKMLNCKKDSKSYRSF